MGSVANDGHAVGHHFLGLLTAIVIDQPFVGIVKVRPGALAAVLADFGSQ